MTLRNKKYLLQIARKAIENYCLNKKIIQFDVDAMDNELLEKRATFVTITKNNELRGCIGELEPQKPLYQSVIDNSLASAFLDPRFLPVQSDELKELQIEISILGSLNKLKTFNNISELLDYLRQKKPGLVINKNAHRATFLPQVWQELPQPEDFLSQLCLKAGLASNEWQKLDIEMFEYQVEEFKESQ